ncbi:MAG: GPR endopeptidase [Clostridia bacterium]|nr:GPR endopeptidase [Clostridia bacterium]
MGKTKVAENNQLIGDIVFKGAYGVVKYEGVLDSQVASKMGKLAGRYSTLNCSLIIHSSIKARKYVTNLLAQTLITYLRYPIKVLVVGMGNAFMVADSLGSVVVKNLLTTHNWVDLINTGLGDVSGLITGVSGINGFDTSELVRCVVNMLQPNQVVLIDTFMAKDSSRIGCSFQLSDTGIRAGGGLNSGNKTIDKSLLGVPTICIGVPLMIDATAFGAEESFTLTPKEIDIYTTTCGKILAHALNFALHGKNYKNFLY